MRHSRQPIFILQFGTEGRPLEAKMRPRVGGLARGCSGRGAPSQGLGRDFLDAQAVCPRRDHVDRKASSFGMGTLGVCVVKAIIADDAQRRDAYLLMSIGTASCMPNP